MVTRRDVSKGLAGGAVALLASATVRGSEVDVSSVVKTTAGPIKGSVKDGVLSFLGVPYGASTAGNGRFMPPQPPQPWSDVRITSAYGDSCPQPGFFGSPFAKPLAPGEAPPPPTDMQKEVATLFPRGGMYEGKQGENCLVLNVWTRGLDAAKRPVMVWLHGGGFAQGSGSDAPYEGTRLCKRGDVLVVTLNHRLNAFGYLYLGGIAGDAFAQSGNIGMLDIVAALRWVRDNISAFGGDPGNVTIFGESGGAGKVSVMCALPAAKGLFHKAIMQSGPSLRISDKEHGTAIARQLLSDLGLSAKQVPVLQKLEAAKLVAAAAAAERKIVPPSLGAGPMGLVPLVDDVVLHHHPFDTTASPESASIPFMVGSTKDEALLFVGPNPDWGHFSDAEQLGIATASAGPRGQEALDLYKRLYTSDSPSYRLVNLITDGWMRKAADRVAELKVKQGTAPVYVFVVEWEINPVLRSPHTTDVPLAFDTLDAAPTLAAAPGSQQVADQMSSAWIAFARTGNPNTPNLPSWPNYSLTERPTMLFNVRSRVVDDYRKEARIFWAS